MIFQSSVFISSIHIMGNCCITTPDEEPTLPPALQRSISLDEPVDWEKIIEENRQKRQREAPPQTELIPYVVPYPIVRKNCLRFSA